MNVNLKLLIVLLLTSSSIIYSACDGTDSFKIIGSYYVFQNELNDHSYKLMCKLSCKDDAIIDNVKTIKWSNRVILIGTKKPNDFYLIIAKKEQLSCCNGDIKIGPFKEIYIDSISNQYGVKGLNNSKSF